MTAPKMIADLPDGMLTFGRLFKHPEHGKPSLHSQELAVEASDGRSYLFVNKGALKGSMNVWVYDVEESKREGELIGDTMHVPAGMNPYPAVGEPVWDGGPIAVKVHSLEHFVEDHATGRHLGAEGRLVDSPLQRARRKLAGAGVHVTHVRPAIPPPRH